MVDKKGSIMPIVIVVGGLIALLLLVFVLGFGWSIIKNTTDDILPELTTMGEVYPGINLSESMVTATTPIDSIIGNFGMMIGIVYLLGIVGVLALAYTFRGSLNGWTIALFFGCILLMVVISILISNAYEEFYNTNDEIGQTLQSAGMLSFFILYSPHILTIVAFIAGIILFTGGGNEQYV